MYPYMSTPECVAAVRRKAEEKQMIRVLSVLSESERFQFFNPISCLPCMASTSLLCH